MWIELMLSKGDGSITFLEFMVSASRVLFGSLARNDEMTSLEKCGVSFFDATWKLQKFNRAFCLIYCKTCVKNMELETTLCVTKRQNQGGRSVAEAGPEVIEALLLDLANHSGQEKTKDFERPRHESTRIEKCQRIGVGSNLCNLAVLELFQRSIAIELLSLSFIHIHSTSVARRFEDILATVRSWEGTEVSNKVPRYRGAAECREHTLECSTPTNCLIWESMWHEQLYTNIHKHIGKKFRVSRSFESIDRFCKRTLQELECWLDCAKAASWLVDFPCLVDLVVFLSPAFHSTRRLDVEVGWCQNSRLGHSFAGDAEGSWEMQCTSN